MAAVQLRVADWNGSAGTIDVTYDDQTLAASAIAYQNQNPQPAAVTVTVSGTPHQFTLAANSAPNTIDISALSMVMVSRTGTHGGTFVGLPANVVLNIRYPA